MVSKLEKYLNKCWYDVHLDHAIVTTVRTSHFVRGRYTQINLFEISLKQTDIRLYILVSD